MGEMYLIMILIHISLLANNVEHLFIRELKFLVFLVIFKS